MHGMCEELSEECTLNFIYKRVTIVSLRRCYGKESGKTMVSEYNEYVREALSAAGDIVIKSMMGGYLVYLNGKLIGDICDNELFLKRTPTSDRMLAESELVIRMKVQRL